MGFRGTWDTSARRNLRRVLVVGAGRAGVAAAEELRRQGFGGEITVMCDEVSAPYDRPSCSKGILTGHKRPKDARMPVQDGLAINWAMGRTAVHLDPQRRIVTADTDEEFRYDGLVIATGARPVWPTGWPRGEPGLHALHGLADAWALRRALHRARRVAVVGGGLTGCEVACAVRSMARECVLIDSRPQLMSRALGEVVGQYVTEVIADDGVRLRLGRRCRRLDRGRRGWVLTLDDGSQETADLVVATVGERPDTRWLAGTGLDVSDGVRCDEHLRAVGGQDIVACGTVARWPNLRYGTEPRRVGQWIMALEQGRAAAAALMGSDHPARPAALVPRFWSEQFGLRIQVCGEVDGSADVTVQWRRPGRRTSARAGVLVHYHRDGERIGVVAVNAVRAFTTIAREMLAAPPPSRPRYAPPPRPRLIEATPASLAQLPEPPASGWPDGYTARGGYPAPAGFPGSGRFSDRPHTIDVPPSAVRDLPYPADEPGPGPVADSGGRAGYAGARPRYPDGEAPHPRGSRSAGATSHVDGWSRPGPPPAAGGPAPWGDQEPSPWPSGPDEVARVRPRSPRERFATGQFAALR